MAKRRLTDADLAEHFSEQLQFLQASADAFDAGYDGEAKRLAVTLRVLLHDTDKSRSLLGQLRRKDELFWDSAGPDTGGVLLSYGGLIAIRLGAGEATYIAPLDRDEPHGSSVDFDAWWKAIVFRAPDGTKLSRRDLICTAANQDGGAHVDATLDERYARFALDNAMGYSHVCEETATPMNGAVRVAIRQIAHEVLRTLVPGYRKVQRPGMNDTTARTSSVEVTIRVPEPAEPCPCGSGRKYGECHGVASRYRLSFNVHDHSTDPCPCGSGKKYGECHGDGPARLQLFIDGGEVTCQCGSGRKADECCGGGNGSSSRT